MTGDHKDLLRQPASTATILTTDDVASAHNAANGMLAEQRDKANTSRCWNELKGCERSHGFTSIERPKF